MDHQNPLDQIANALNYRSVKPRRRPHRMGGEKMLQLGGAFASIAGLLVLIFYQRPPATPVGTIAIGTLIGIWGLLGGLLVFALGRFVQSLR